MSAALALNCRELEKDPSPAADLSVECFACDPDNPRSVPRGACRSCNGTGRAKVAIASVVEEIKSSRLELLVGDKNKHRRSDDDF
jgi:hypothetical protein